MSEMQLKDGRFVGCFTAIVTPFNSDGASVDYARLEEQMEFQAAGGVAGVVICGTTGESPTLSEHEYRELASRAIELAHKKRLVAIVGTGSNSTAHAIELHRFAASAGADGSLSVNPYYNKPTQEGLYRHFKAVAESADLPVMLYNIPGRTGVALSPGTVERLSELRNIVSVKEATGSTDSATEIAMRCPTVSLLSGDDGMTLPYGAVGGRGVVSVLSNVVPERVVALCEAIRERRWEAALHLHRVLFGLCGAMFAETNPIPVKAAMKLLGRDSGALRLPMTPATETTVAKLREALRRAELLN